jgi:hypothetical protein
LGTDFNSYSYTHTYSKPHNYTYTDTNADSTSYSHAESDSEASPYPPSAPNAAAVNQARRIWLFFTQQWQRNLNKRNSKSSRVLARQK